MEEFESQSQDSDEKTQQGASLKSFLATLAFIISVFTLPFLVLPKRCWFISTVPSVVIIVGIFVTYDTWVTKQFAVKWYSWAASGAAVLAGFVLLFMYFFA